MILWKIGECYSTISVVIYMNEYINRGKQILRHLKQNGYEGYFVGGAVRDYQLGLDFYDIDITTNATPEEVISLFERVKETGKKYGTVTVFLDEYNYEVTTYRFDGEYKDNRRPDGVTYSTNIIDDLSRRDFTMNAMIMDEDEVVYDHFNAKEDLQNKLIRTINNPVDRFNEDALRMLRAFRFVSKLGFDIEEETLRALSECKSLIKNIAIERVMVELDKIIQGPHRNKALQYMKETKFDEELYGIDQGLHFIQTFEDKVSTVEAFIIAFIKGEWDNVWRFSNKQGRLIKQVINLHEVTKEDEFNHFIVFVNSQEVCLLVNKINVLLGYKDQSTLINDIGDNLVVRDVCDLKFKGQDILELTTLKKRSIIALVIDDLLYNVIMGIMPNEYNVLKEFALKRVEELQRESDKHE